MFHFRKTLYSLETGSHYVTLTVLELTEICLPQSAGIKGMQHHAQPPLHSIFKLQTWPFPNPLKILFLDFLAERVKEGFRDSITAIINRLDVISWVP